MFGRKKAEPRQTVILEGTEVRGAIHAAGNVVIEGVLDGDLASEGAVMIGASGLVRGNVMGAMISIAGRVEGTVLAHGRLTMLGGGRLQGDAQYGTLEVLRGGVIEGRSTPLGPSSALPPPMSAPPPPMLPAAAGHALGPSDPTPTGLTLEPRHASEPPPAPAEAVGHSSAPPPRDRIVRTVVRLPPPPPPSNVGPAAGTGTG